MNFRIVSKIYNFFAMKNKARTVGYHIVACYIVPTFIRWR